MANKKKSKKQSISTSGHHGSSSSSVVASVTSTNQNIANVRNIFTQPVNLDSCLLCDDHKPKGLSKKSKRQGVIPHTLTNFWLEAPIKKKLQLLQMDCKFVLDQIRCSSPYTTKEGDKPAFLSKPSSCLCPACRKKKAIFNAVIAVFEDYVNELEGKPPSANSASQQVAASFQYSTKLKPNNTPTQQPLALSSECTTSNNNSTSTTAQPSTTTTTTTSEQPTSVPNNVQQGSLTENDHVLVSKQLSKISEKTQFLIEDEANSIDNNNSSISSTTNATETSQIVSSENTSTPNEIQLPFGRYLTVKNGKITVTDDYVRKDNGEHFLKVIQKCEEAFPLDLKLAPNEFPIPENIHTLINYCTANSEVNIKKILLKNAKKAFSNNNNNNHHHSLTSPQTQNQTTANNSNVMTSQILNLFQQQQGGATATLTLGSNGTVLNNVNVQMVTDSTKQNTKTIPPTSSQNSSSLSTSHLQVQVPPSVTITATSSTIQTHSQKSSVVVHSSSHTSSSPNSSTAALVVSGSIDMTSTGSGSAQNMKVVNGSIAMVHLGNVKDLIRGGESNSNATVVLNNLHHEDDEEEDEDDEDDVLDDEDDEEEDEEGEDEEDLESDEETLDDYSHSDTDEEITNDKGSANHTELRLKNRSFEHDDQYYSKRKIARDKRHGHQKEGDNQKEQDEKNEILASNMRESKLLFQIYLARLFSHNIRVAYNDLCASEMQKCLLEEYERESEMKTSNSSKNSKNKKSKKSKEKKKEEKPTTPAKKPTSAAQNKTPEKQPIEIPKPSEEPVSPNQSISTNNDYESADENSEQDNLNTEEQEEDDYYESLDYDYAYDDDDFENRGAIQDWNVVTKKPKQPKSVPTGGTALPGTTTPRGTSFNTYSNRGRGGLSVRGGRGGSHSSLSSPLPKPTTVTNSPGTPSKATTSVSGGTPQKSTPSFYSISNPSGNPNINQPKIITSTSEKQHANHQFHSQHVKNSTSSTTMITPSNSGNISGTPLPVPVPVPVPVTTAQQLPQIQPQQSLPQTQQGGFILLPSAVNGANSKITKHSRQQSSSSVSSNNTSTSLESPMHSFVNQPPSAGNSTVSSVVGELLNDDEYLMLSGLKRSTTPSTGASTSSPNSVGSGPNMPNPQAFQNQHSLFSGSNTLFDSSSFGNIAKNNLPSGNTNSPRSNSLIYNPFEMGMQYNNPNMMPQYNTGALGMNNGLYQGFNLFGPPTTNSSFPMTGTIQQQAPQQQSNASWSLFQGYGSFSWNPIMGNNGNLSNMNLGGISNVNPQQQPPHSTPFNGSNSTMKNTVPSE